MNALPAGARAAATAPNGCAAHVALLRVDAGLRSAIPAEELAFAERVVIAPRRDLKPGPWSPATIADHAQPLGALILDGIITHEVILAGRCNAELFGPGDVFRPWSAAESVLPCTTRWTTTGATLAVLDQRFLTAARRWPGLSAAIHERLADQADRAALRTAIIALPRVEQRVLAVFWQLAERWGVVRPGGVAIGLAVTHAVIGQLVGAQRPTVSLALQELADAGLLQRTGPSEWTLNPTSLEALAGGDQAVRPGADPAVDVLSPMRTAHSGRRQAVQPSDRGRAGAELQPAGAARRRRPDDRQLHP
jgi:CRP/FNR family cyclic AMP-dependent transcriptional regulator